MAEYKGMDPEAMRLFDGLTQRRAEDSVGYEPRTDHDQRPFFSAPGEREVLHVVQRSISARRGRPTSLKGAVEIFTEQRKSSRIQGLGGKSI